MIRVQTRQSIEVVPLGASKRHIFGGGVAPDARWCVRDGSEACVDLQEGVDPNVGAITGNT